MEKTSRRDVAQKRWVILCAVLIWLAAPVSFIGALFVLNAFNPMQLVFLSSFTIENRSGTEVWVMPIGMYEGSGRYGPLPRFRNYAPPAIPASWRDGVHLLPGQSERVTYDSDDVNFRHLLVRTQSGKVFIVDTDKKGDRQSCYAAEKKKYVVPPVAHLHEASAELRPCARGQRVRYSGGKEY